jgi:DNA-binding transcriptional LysR family regulator
MLNWDNIRFFLAVARGGSVRAAADALKVNHSTVIRRIESLEEDLGSSVFEKLPSGYKLTTSGQEVLDLAAQMEASSDKLRDRIFGRDQSVTGILRVALMPLLATELLMPDFAEFGTMYPDVELELLTSHDPVNLVNRQADVALRLIFDGSSPPPHLHGAPLQEIYSAVYMSRMLLDVTRAESSRSVKWVIKTDEPPPVWATPGTLNLAPTVVAVSDLEGVRAAVRAGMGIGTLLCFVGDADPHLVRVPGTARHRFGTLWILTHGDTRKTKRVRVFSDFVKRRLSNRAGLLLGEEQPTN